MRIRYAVWPGVYILQIRRFSPQVVKRLPQVQKELWESRFCSSVEGKACPFPRLADFEQLHNGHECAALSCVPTLAPRNGTAEPHGSSVLVNVIYFVDYHMLFSHKTGCYVVICRRKNRWNKRESC